jgi:hypothetical protein
MVTPTNTAAAIRALKLNGFGGGCYAAARVINDRVFGGRGKLVGAANKFWLDQGCYFGHVAVEHGGKFWDADAEPKDWEDVESWGMLDPEDTDYHTEGWGDDAAYGVARVEGEALDAAWRER